MSDDNRSKQAVRKPNPWGLKAADRVSERISVVHNRLGFDPEKPWELFSLETYEGKMGNLSNYLHSHLEKAFLHLEYEDRKAIFSLTRNPEKYLSAARNEKARGSCPFRTRRCSLPAFGSNRF